MKRFAISALLMFFPILTFAQQPTLAPKPDNLVPAKHATGLVLPSIEVRRDRHAAEARRHAINHANLSMRLAEPLPATYDCTNLDTPIKDQRNCGNCWWHSTIETVESANIKVKNLSNSGTNALSQQFELDPCSSFRNGGCGGDDASNAFTWLKAGGGIPLQSVYGPYVGGGQACQLSTTATGFTINDWGYVSSSTGIPTPDLIKAAMMQFGPISVCIAADNAFIGFSGGSVFKDTGYNQINHQVVVDGWDDSKNAWHLRNSWGTSWADAGWCWIAYGANQVGTEAMYVVAGTPIVIQPGSTPAPRPRPTRRLAALLADLPALVDKYNDGTDADKFEVLSLLDDVEKRVNSSKQMLGLAK